MTEQTSLFGNRENAEYAAFVDKFKPKLTTDDCYTPPEVMDAVYGFVARRFGRDPSTFVRPFFPGGDFENYGYPDGCTVVDNPPFSIYAKIVRFYLARGIDFFLFGPSLTMFVNGADCCYYVANASVVYENGASVPKPFRWYLPNIDPDNLPYTLAGLAHDFCYGSEKLSKDLADDLFRGTMRDAGIPRRKASFAEWLVEHFAGSHYGKKHDRNGIRFYGKLEIVESPKRQPTVADILDYD